LAAFLLVAGVNGKAWQEDVTEKELVERLKVFLEAALMETYRSQGKFRSLGYLA
jgi:hypothetical protein